MNWPAAKKLTEYWPENGKLVIQGSSGCKGRGRACIVTAVHQDLVNGWMASSQESSHLRLFPLRMCQGMEKEEERNDS